MRVVCFLVVCLVAGAGSLSAQSDPPTLQEIIRRAAENDETRRRHRQSLEYNDTVKTERLNAVGRVLRTETKHLTRREGPQATYTAEDRTSPGQDAGAEQALAAVNLAKLASRYTCQLAGEDTVRGRACYVVQYLPRPGQPANSREEKVLNHLRGSFHIDKSTFEILQGQGSLSAPVMVALVASITRVNFDFQTQTLPNGEAGPARFNMDLIVQAPLYFYRQRQTSQQRNWRPAAKATLGR